MTKVAQGLVAFALLFAAGIGLWQFWGGQQGNKLVDAANAAIDEGNTLTTEGAKYYGELFNTATLKDFPGNRAKLKPTVEKASDLLSKSALKFRESAAKFSEAGKQMVDSQVADYWKFKGEQVVKLAESKETRSKIALLLLDETITDINKLNEKITPLGELAKKQDAETDEIGKKADKIKTDHAAKFK